MNDKTDVSYIEEQPARVGDHSSNMELIHENGIVLIPQPTADPNGNDALFRRSTAMLTDCAHRSIESATVAQVGHHIARVGLRMHFSSARFRTGSYLLHGASIISGSRPQNQRSSHLSHTSYGSWESNVHANGNGNRQEASLPFFNVRPSRRGSVVRAFDELRQPHCRQGNHVSGSRSK